MHVVFQQRWTTQMHSVQNRIQEDERDQLSLPQLQCVSGADRIDVTNKKLLLNLILIYGRRAQMGTMDKSSVGSLELRTLDRRIGDARQKPCGTVQVYQHQHSK